MCCPIDVCTRSMLSPLVELSVLFVVCVFALQREFLIKALICLSLEPCESLWSASRLSGGRHSLFTRLSISSNVFGLSRYPCCVLLVPVVAMVPSSSLW